MNRLTHLLDPNSSIVLELDVSSRKRVFEEAAQRIALAEGCDKKAVFDALIAREKLGSTALPNAVAIPHARVEGISEPCLVFLRTKEPIDYDGAAEPGVQLFFVMAIPANSSDEHLATLSEIAQFLQNSQNREHLMHAQTSLEVHQILSAWSPQG